MIGRACLTDQPQLAGCTVLTHPTLLRVVAVQPRPLEAQTWVVVEGRGLPAWTPGRLPQRFTTLADLAAWLAQTGAYAPQRACRYCFQPVEAEYAAPVCGTCRVRGAPVEGT